PGRALHAGAQPEEQRGLDIAHRDIADRYVFERGTVDGFEREAAAAVEDDVGDRDVLESAIRFGAELYPATAPESVTLERAVDQRAEVVAADHAIVDRDVLRRPKLVERVRTLQHDRVVTG